MFNFYNMEKEMLENDFEFHDFLGPGNTVRRSVRVFKAQGMRV